MRLDTHQHFWNYNPVEYPWIVPGGKLSCNFAPDGLRPLLQGAGLEGSIAVQARQTLEETRWLLGLADQHSWIAGVVGWVDLRSEQLEAQLAELRNEEKLVGVRHVVQDEADDRFLLSKPFQRGIERLGPLVYELLIYPHQLPAAIELVARFPEQRFVLDHLAKPPIRDGRLSPWREDLLRLGEAPNVWCKVSGMVTEASWGNWRAADFRPYLDTVVRAFGWKRLMYGSDWPVCLLAGSYEQVLGLTSAYVEEVAPEMAPAFFGETAMGVYRIKRDAEAANG